MSTIAKHFHFIPCPDVRCRKMKLFSLSRVNPIDGLRVCPVHEGFLGRQGVEVVAAQDVGRPLSRVEAIQSSIDGRRRQNDEERKQPSKCRTGLN